MSRIFVDELEIGAPDYELEVGSGTHGVQTARALERIEAVLDELRPWRWSSQATSTRRSPARSPESKLGIPVAHLEAGLRSFDRTMPEEINRVLTDQLSHLVLHPQPGGSGEPCPRGNRLGSACISSATR